MGTRLLKLNILELRPLLWLKETSLSLTPAPKICRQEQSQERLKKPLPWIKTKRYSRRLNLICRRSISMLGLHLETQPRRLKNWGRRLKRREKNLEIKERHRKNKGWLSGERIWINLQEKVKLRHSNKNTITLTKWAQLLKKKLPKQKNKKRKKLLTDYSSIPREEKIRNLKSFKRMRKSFSRCHPQDNSWISIQFKTTVEPPREERWLPRIKVSTLRYLQDLLFSNPKRNNMIQKWRVTSWLTFRIWNAPKTMNLIKLLSLKQET